MKNRPPSTVWHAPQTPVLAPTGEGVKGTVLNFFVDVAATPPNSDGIRGQQTA